MRNGGIRHWARIQLSCCISFPEIFSHFVYTFARSILWNRFCAKPLKKNQTNKRTLNCYVKKIVLSFVSPLILSYLCQAIQSKCLRHSLSWCKYEENKYNIYLPLNKIPIEFLFNSNVLQKLICVTVEDSK